MIMCPNHKTEQEQTGTASDGEHLRPVLACGCSPTWEETQITPVSAAIILPDPPAPTIEDDNSDGVSHLAMEVASILQREGMVRTNVEGN